MSTNKQQKMQEIVDFFDRTHLTTNDFIKAFSAVVKVVNEVKSNNNKFILDLREKVKTLETGTKDNQSTVNKQIKSLLLGELKNFEDKLGAKTIEMDKKVSLLKDGRAGKDADEKKIIKKSVKEVLKQIPKPEKEEKEFGIEDIIGLKKELKNLKKGIKINSRRPLFGGSGGGGYSGGRSILAFDLSDSLDGVTKTFSLPAFWRVIMVESSSFPNSLRKTTDYTTDASAMKITFTSEIDASTVLASGQTITVLYSEH